MKWLGPAVVVALAILAELALGRASSAPEFGLFLGRFHPLVVHLPIGFFLLVALAEAATFVPKLRDRVEPALGLLVPLSAIAALAAFSMGQLLALEGGFPAEALGWHRRLTLLAVIGMSACWVFYERQRSTDGRGRLAYRGALAATLGLLSLGAHFGGTMTRGESYLSKYAPGPLKPLLGAPEPEKSAGRAAGGVKEPASEPLVFAQLVQPILNNYCFECHGTEKQKGKLRVDGLELLLAGGENGPVLVPGDAKKSSLVARMLLPITDDDHMPPEGKPSPKPEELALIQFWIERGASPTLKVRDTLAPVVSRSLLEQALGGSVLPSAVPVAATPRASDSAPAPSEPTPATPKTANDAARAPGSEPVPAAPAATEAPSGGAVHSGPAFLATYCEKCHGSAKVKGKLRVDSMAALLKGGAGGTALVPGKPEQSSLVQRLRLPLDNDDHMPPKKEPQPSAAEIATLAAWIRSGAAGSVAPAPRASTPEATEPASVAETPAATAPASTIEPAPAVAAAAVSAPADAALLQGLPQSVALFSAAIQPLFRDKCGKCHIREKPAGGLGVEQHAQLIEGGYSGAGIVPRDRKASLVLQRLVLPLANEEHMPPEGEPELSADEVELVGAWIDQGAPDSAVTETAKLTAGAARALKAHGVSGNGAAPAPLAAQSGGCGACSVPGASSSKWLDLQALALLGVVSVLSLRRRGRSSRAA